MLFLSNIKKGKISLEEVNNLQKDCEDYLKRIRKRNKNDEQKKP